MTDKEPSDERVLVLAPTTEDAAFSRTILSRAGLECEICTDLNELSVRMTHRAGAILLTEGALGTGNPDQIVAALQRQEEWSDIPVLLLAGGGADAPAAVWLMETMGNVTVLDRPVRVITLVSALRSAIKARRRQYQLRDQLDAVRQTQQRLHDAARRKDEFLATLAHELRNPLAPISNALHLLHYSALGDAQIAPAVAMMDRQVSHMVRLVDDLLEVSRITRGNVELRRESVDLEAILATALEAADPLIKFHRHAVNLDLPQQPVYLNADPVRLAQVFTNLLNNAAKYTETGGSITIAASISANADAITVRVTDTGVGIPASMLDRVFDMFTQAEDGGEHSRGGLGIGLTLARSLVELHGGTIGVRSAGTHQGSEFEVTLPLTGTRTAPRAHQAVPAKRPETLSGRRILIVDDNRDAADSLGILLRRVGAAACVVYDGESGLEAAVAFGPDAVLLDIGMPGMNGFELARRIRTSATLANLTLIALTGWGQEERRRESRAAGIDHHLVKPVDFSMLCGLLSASHSLGEVP